MQTTCPQCSADDSIELSGELRLCLACRYEWDQTKTYAPVATPTDEVSNVAPTDVDVDRILAATSAEEVLTVPGVRDDPPIVASAHTGPVSTPIDLAGQWLKEADLVEPRLCVLDEGTNTVTVADAEGNEQEWERSRVEIVDFDPLALAPTIGAETVSDNQPFDPAIFATASLAITMGLMAVGDDPARTLYNPRIGWLPPPCNEVPEVEQGVAYAIAVLVQVFDLPRGDVENIAATLMLASIPNQESDQQ